MNDADDFEPDDDQPRYAGLSEIDASALRAALWKLHLLRDDPFLRMQAFSLAVVDQFITGLEYEVLRKLIDDERTPVPEASFLSAHPLR